MQNVSYTAPQGAVLFDVRGPAGAGPILLYCLGVGAGAGVVGPGVGIGVIFEAVGLLLAVSVRFVSLL